MFSQEFKRTHCKFLNLFPYITAFFLVPYLECSSCLLWSSQVSPSALRSKRLQLGNWVNCRSHFVSFLSGITVLHCLLCNVWSSCLTHFVQISSCLQRENKSVISYSRSQKRESFCFHWSKADSFFIGEIPFLISYFPFPKMGLILFLFPQKLSACYYFTLPCFRLFVHPGINTEDSISGPHMAYRFWRTDLDCYTQVRGGWGSKISTTVLEEFFSLGDCEDGMRTNWK